MNKKDLLDTLDILIELATRNHSIAYSTDKYFYAGGISALQEVRKMIEETKDE